MSGKITKFVMEDIRCFAGRQELEIRPLTFLVGENSTGKSTALGCFQVLANYLSREFRRVGELDFNVDPYSMGSFADIVARKRPAGNGFRLGFKIEGETKKTETTEYMIQLVEREQSAEPMVNCIKVKFNDGDICFNHKEKTSDRSDFHIKHIKLVDKETRSFRIDCNLLDPWTYLDILFSFQRGFRYRSKTLLGEVETKEEKSLIDFLSKKDVRKMLGHSLTSFSFAPVRSRPKRTYDPTREFENPEGGDIPMMIRRMENMKNNQWESLKNQLVKFGKASGLFEGIEVKKHGKSMSESFQIQVKVRGPKSNIMDVGYGISQVLPILIKIFSDRHSRFFLIQQPEVHLHPRGQAELASLFARLSTNSGKTFIIETHSDYMIDRTTIEIRNGTIKPENVSLIYMEPKGSHVKAHNIGFDEEGNLKNVPKSYREFFLRETDKMLGYED